MKHSEMSKRNISRGYNDVTGDSLTTANKPHTEAYEEGYKRLFGEKQRHSIRDYEDANSVDLVCSTCMKPFKGHSGRVVCNFCR